MILDDLADLISTGGVSTTVYKGRMPEGPGDFIALYETGGTPPLHAMASGPGQAFLERAGVQVVSRSASYQTARLNITAVDVLFNGLRPRTINGIQYHFIEAQQSPFFLKTDDNDRRYIAVNYIVQKALSTA